MGLKLRPGVKLPVHIDLARTVRVLRFAPLDNDLNALVTSIVRIELRPREKC
jgi:hypothetical protein